MKAREYAVGEATAHVVRQMRRLRLQRDWSARKLDELMKAAGYTLPAAVITNLENSRRENMTVENLVGLAKVFNCSPEYLLGLGGVGCGVCNDSPPRGFSCITCGAWSSNDVVAAEIFDA